MKYSLPCGDENPFSKLTSNDIPEIRKLISEGVSHFWISKKFNVTKSCIQAIADKRNWKHIT